jgi:tetratricopeptide (TPR) repeat protein
MRAAHGVVSYAAYLRKTLLPFDLAVFYPHPITHPAWKVAGSLALLAALTALAAWHARRRPVLLVGWLWFLGMMLPVSGFFQTGDQALADRYTYLPLIGLFLVAAWGGLDLARAIPLRRLGLALIPGLAVVLCAWLAAAQARTWRNTRALFERAVAVTADNYVAQAVLGHEWARAGQPGEAIRFFARALEIKPSYFEGRSALADQLAAQQQFPAAVSNYQAALAINPNYPDALLGLGNVLLATGQSAEALAHLEKVVALRPDSTPALGRLAWLLATHREERVRNGPRAVELARRACALAGNRDALLLNTLAAAYAETGQFEQATATAQQALALARSGGQDKVAAIIGQLLALYQSRTPYRE